MLSQIWLDKAKKMSRLLFWLSIYKMNQQTTKTAAELKVCFHGQNNSNSKRKHEIGKNNNYILQWMVVDLTAQAAKKGQTKNTTFY